MQIKLIVLNYQTFCVIFLNYLLFYVFWHDYLEFSIIKYSFDVSLVDMDYLAKKFPAFGS